MSEETSSSQSNKTPGPVRFRSRFPKAQPNLAVSTGLARIRKISGHFDTTTPTTPNENHSESTRPPSPAPVQTTRQLIDSVLSPKPIQNEDDISKSPVKQPENPPPQSPNLTFRQLINQTSSQPGTPIPNGAVPVAAFLNNTQAYNPQFTKEHIMNIIKLKAMQKLKKIESENLKEKRKKNKKNSILFKKVDNEGQAGSSLVNNNETIIDKSKLRMRDFLYYNPKSTKKNEEVILADDSCSRSSYNEQILGRINRSSSSISLVNSEADTNESISSKASSISSSLKLPLRSVPLAPQLRINDDGSIVINEESLVIQREEPEPVYESTVVESEHGDNLNYNSYRKFHHTKKWSEKETAKFYKALSMVGTDFTMIQKFFQHRNRDEIKRKFKREEKINQALIDKILSKTIQIDLSFFVSSSSGDDEENNKNADDKATNATNKKVKKNKKNESKDETLSSKKDDKDTKKKEKLKRIQKRAFVESESETETTQKKKSTPSPLDQTTNSILIEDLKNKKTDIIEKTQEILEKEEQVRHSNLTPVVQSISEENLEKLPPCSSLFETNRATLEILNEQIIMSENNTTKEAPESDSESIELVFDLDSQLIDEKRRVDINKIENEPRKDLILKEESKESSDSDSEIILDLDNNTIIRQNSSIQQESATSSTSKSSITITKIGDLKKQ